MGFLIGWVGGLYGYSGLDLSFFFLKFFFVKAYVTLFVFLLAGKVYSTFNSSVLAKV